MRRDDRILDARHAAILQMLAEELRGIIARRGGGAGGLDSYPLLLESMAAELLVGGGPQAARARESRRRLAH